MGDTMTDKTGIVMIYKAIPHRIKNVVHDQMSEQQCQWLVVMGMYDTLNILLGETVTYGK